MEQAQHQCMLLHCSCQGSCLQVPSPGPFSRGAPCHGYLSRATGTELSMTKPAQSRDKGAQRWTRGIRSQDCPSSTLCHNTWRCEKAAAWAGPVLFEGMVAGAMEMRDKWFSCTHRDQSITGGLCQGINSSSHCCMARGEQWTGNGDTVTWRPGTCGGDAKHNNF